MEKSARSGYSRHALSGLCRRIRLAGGAGKCQCGAAGVCSGNDTAYTVTVPVGTRTTQLTYAVNAEDTVEITDCENDAAGDLEIPAEIDGKTVTSIGDSAFLAARV